MFIDIIPTGLLQGLILALVALGVMIPFRLLNFPDLSAEGSFPLGGAVCACLMLLGVPFFIAIPAAMLAAGAVGILTAAIHLRLQVNTLLAGIIVATMVYSINLRLLAQPNVALFDVMGMFNYIGANTLLRLLILSTIVVMIAVPLRLYLATEHGLCMRAVGLNPQFAAKQNISLNKYTYLGLFMGNALVGLAGSLMVQLQGYADVGMGVGIVIHALAALMIGESIIGTDTLLKQICAPLLGALLYQQIQGVALALGLAPSDLKLLTGIIVLLVIAIRRQKLCTI